MFNYFAFAQSKISDTQLFIVGYEPTATYHLHYYKITFGNTAVDWANKILWSGTSWASTTSSSLISTDGLKIYTFVLYGSSSLFIYFTTFELSTGKVLGTRYKSSEGTSLVIFN